MRHRSPRSLLLVAALLALIAAACGDDGGTSAGSSGAPASTTGGTGAATFPITIGTGASAVTIDKKPARIVSLSPTATEMLFAIGAGPQVVAVDDQSNFPPEAPKSTLSGFTPNIEAIAGRSPDLVVAQYDSNNLVAGLKALKITVLLQPPATTVAGSYTQMEQLGAATGNVGGAVAAVGKMKSEMDKLAASVKKPATPLKYFHEVDNTLYTATSSTFIGDVYRMVGLTNIADAADKDKTGYPQVSAELILQADPDIIFLADGETPASVAARPGWSQLKAVRNGAVVVVDTDLASRWGPRTPLLLDAVVKGLAKVPATAAR
jgi:iron complex transport system substrate-binding protein